MEELLRQRVPNGKMRRMTIEETLGRIEEYAGLLKFTTEAGTTSPFPPDATALAHAQVLR